MPTEGKMSASWGELSARWRGLSACLLPGSEGYPEEYEGQLERSIVQSEGSVS